MGYPPVSTWSVWTTQAMFVRTYSLRLPQVSTMTGVGVRSFVHNTIHRMWTTVESWRQSHTPPWTTGTLQEANRERYILYTDPPNPACPLARISVENGCHQRSAADRTVLHSRRLPARLADPDRSPAKYGGHGGIRHGTAAVGSSHHASGRYL